jgi:hypothetical protein
MKKLFVFVIIISSILLSGCQSAKDGFVPSFAVLGDIQNMLRIESMNDFQTEKVKKDDKTLEYIKLKDLIDQAKPNSDDFSIAAVGSDGLTSLIDGSDLSECYIAFSKEFGWECVFLKHPISTAIKDLNEIIIVDNKPEGGNSVTIIDSESQRNTSVGKLTLEGYSFSRIWEGKSEINDRTVEVYTPHRFVPLKSLVKFDKDILICSDTGERMQDRGEGNLELVGNRIDYVSPGGQTVKNVIGIYADAPRDSVTVTSADAAYFLQKGESVLVIELDGLGMNLWNYAEKQGKLNSMFKKADVTVVMSCYPTISPVNLASMLTGKTPNEHGITRRDTKDLLVPDIFEKVKSLNKTSVYIEGDQTLISTSQKPKLNVDQNNNGTDDEVFASAVSELKNNPDFAFVHFHGIDDTIHKNGVLNSKTLAKFYEVQEYALKLAKNWRGRVIIVSDHGAHDINGVGEHGTFSADDLLVPYIIIK